MGKGVCILFIAFCISSCVGKKNIRGINNKSIAIGFREMYSVNKIDSIKNVYLIYAQKDSVLYKIVSLKDSVACTPIKVGEKYAFVLHSRVAKSYNGMDLSPNTLPHITGIMYYGVWIEFEKATNYDVFTSYNLRGLCIQ